MNRHYKWIFEKSLNDLECVDDVRVVASYLHVSVKHSLLSYRRVMNARHHNDVMTISATDRQFEFCKYICFNSYF